MNQTIKAHWVTALRSGNYPQTRGALHRSAPSPGGALPGFCCLGVLCELAVQAGVIERSDDQSLELMGEVGYASTNARGERYAETALLPREVIEWAELDTIYGLQRPEGESDLADLNDQGTPFDAIADIIEREA